MAQCTACGASLRDGVRFCTQCGAPFAAPPAPPPSVATPVSVASVGSSPSAVAPPEPASSPAATPVADAATIMLDAPVASGAEAGADEVPARVPRTEADEPSRRAERRRPSRGGLPPARSSAATWALVTGIAPFIVSVAGNLIAAQLGAQLANGVGSLAALLGVLTIVFVVNAALLTVCGIMGGRGVRETANGITAGRGQAIAGLTLGGLNLVLWVSGLVISTSTLLPLFA